MSSSPFNKGRHKHKINNLVVTHDKSYIQLLRTYMKFDEEQVDNKTVSTWDPTKSEFFKIE